MAVGDEQIQPLRPSFDRTRARRRAIERVKSSHKDDWGLPQLAMLPLILRLSARVYVYGMLMLSSIMFAAVPYAIHRLVNSHQVALGSPFYWIIGLVSLVLHGQLMIVLFRSAKSAGNTRQILFLVLLCMLPIHIGILAHQVTGGLFRSYSEIANAELRSLFVDNLISGSGNLGAFYGLIYFPVLFFSSLWIKDCSRQGNQVK